LAGTENFCAGRRAESQGIGIGTFAYYRRVFDNRRSRIIDGIIKVPGKSRLPRKG
jgi:hypothetical protein